MRTASWPNNGGLTPRPLSNDWVWEPKWNGRRVLLNRSGKCLGKQGQDLTTADEFSKAIEQAQKIHGWEWLDCEGLLWRTKAGKGSLIVLDVPSHMGTYVDRRKWLEDRIPVLESFTDIPNNKLVLTPAFPTIGNLWEHLLELNEQKGETLFDGVIAKRKDSVYREGDTPYWVKFRYKP